MKKAPPTSGAFLFLEKGWIDGSLTQSYISLTILKKPLPYLSVISSNAMS